MNRSRSQREHGFSGIVASAFPISKASIRRGPSRVAYVALFLCVFCAEISAQEFGPEGRVSIFVDANSAFDVWTQNPTDAQKQFMRDHYARMQTYSPYFDGRLSWYPNAWEYEDAYAIYVGSNLAGSRPDWILKDSQGRYLYIPFDCANGTCPQYAADIGNPDFRSHFVESLGQILNAGYRGVWLDDVNLSRIMVSDGTGKLVTPIDPRTGQPMTLTDWRRYFAEFTEEIRSAFPTHEIAHNVHWWTDRTDPYVVRELDAADWINFERGISDSGIRGGTGTYGFETFLGLVDWLHARGKHVVMDDDDDSGIQERDYELSFYLLINDGQGDVLGSDGDRSRIAPDTFWSGYESDLGQAKGEHYRWQGLFRRDFDCGLVLVNQPDMGSISVALPKPLVDIDGQTVATVSLDAASGQVLLDASCRRSPAPNPPANLEVTN